MRKLTDQDLTDIAGMTIQGYHVEGVRVKRGAFTDSDNYGIILGKDSQNCYVTWQFHLLEDNSISAYWVIISQMIMKPRLGISILVIFRVRRKIQTGDVLNKHPLFYFLLNIMESIAKLIVKRHKI